MEYHEVVTKIVGLLKDGGYWYETFEHEPVRTSEEAAKVRIGYVLAQGAKAMIVRVKKSESEKFLAMLVLPGDKRFDIAKVKKFFESKDIRFATEEEVGQITGGVQPGGVPPLGNLFNLPVIADPTLFENEKIIFNAGDKRFSVAMKSEDYKKVVEPKIEAIT
ncbi:hypothetical protein A3A84_00445 [Candidatus Collierbacteria bacterium RIFCSPLOWO2_01_FULL_50_23]|uniref:YbaK/aminoacyl-tRNA synthetase-associated domain-containing protein n=1 Tax=Candidatus Collierbacteria bacterium RIFCSPHIGHO2_01_FULL_50_25 TaxID=1817722 RepID=A0A1F5EWV3_9BACT|nr:MAG: hypothetical protein A2703_03490 [Candidatus Collierbacteria bacterium RIFCSPHIGHO2_01_FULL_50_25]OGD74664.1 MAG: hypothetical protein A3A84_00445 [Candidatus Collierbacteria bacterium RIFCSPLOWO2_01_FULL_50_23]